MLGALLRSRASTGRRALVAGRSQPFFARNALFSAKSESESPLERIAKSFERPSLANADHVLNDFRELVDSEEKIPLSYYFDALRLFTSRHDSLRSELLLRLSKDKLPKKRKLKVIGMPGGQTVPTPQDAYQKLVSFAIGNLVAEGDIEEAMKVGTNLYISDFVDF